MRVRSLLLSLTGATLAISGCGDDSIEIESNSTTSAGSETTAVTPFTSETTSTPTPGSSGGGPGSGSGDDDSGTSTGADTTADDESSTGPVAMCGNGVLEADELCDGTDFGVEDCVSQGFDYGELLCTADCLNYDTSSCVSYVCGNGMAEPGEECDGGDLGMASCVGEGFDSGSVSCNLDCTLDTSGCGLCGNVIVDGDEVCDDVALFGETCENMGFDSGQIACNPDCMGYDTAGCGTCGNGFIDGAEECDTGDLGGFDCPMAGFDSGTLGCNDTDCVFETVGCGICGNDIVDGDEECDDGNTGTQCLPGCTFCPGGGVIFEEDFADNMAGWTLDTEWEIGPAAMSASPGACGNGDPADDHSPTADNGIGGAVIGGNITTTIHPFYYLTSPPIDTSSFTFVELDFWRWLNSDYTPFMENRVEVWDGAAWQIVWQSGGPPNVEDASWTNVVHDIAAYSNPALQVRFGYNVDSGGAYTCSGWNVDDVQVIGVTCPPP